ncbi:Triose-phosphate isomerase [Ectothiorhodospira sp. PHS-1]|uniref:triose-phosphate isomerase n=1 Tax=Ectothiorhodospira sp. PHS-1 TaxID=519989 RepID=UPI00024A884D|nr:triose-phosphate isomerase [Ectothiorhodospira sp. PHS-1]EHQ52426.1 Triose-phosphate isomerase [Ectothiorhodospira sp. PHS-1]
MRRPLVAGNWKLNGSRNANQTLMQALVGPVSELGKVDVAVCPPFVYLEQVAGLCRDGGIALGAQDVSDQDSGAFTGEVSGDMLREMGCTCVIVGHSERRTLYGEDDAFTARKFAAARRHGLTPILCVGELLEEREAGVTESVVARQLDAVLAVEGIEALADAVIAYEPVWAIGTGRTATPEQAQAVHAFIRARLADRDPAVARKVRILYGGSVKADNAAELFAQPDIDGGLIGGASLKASDFLAICKAAEQAG